MANDLVEKVARAICFETGSMGDPTPIEMQRVDRDWQKHTTAAEAAIDTIRAEIAEPSEAMIKSGAREVDWYDHNAIDCWRSMLAASPLGEKKDG